MIAKTLVLLFVVYNLQPSQGGSIKFAQLLKQPQQVQDLISSIHFQMDSIDNQFDLVSLKLKTNIATAKLNTKLELKQFQTLVKSVKDATCGPPARAALKMVEKRLDDLKKCGEKEAVKLLKTQIINYLRTLNSQAYVITDYCHLMHPDVAEYEECVNAGAKSLNDELEEAKQFSSASVSQVEKNGETCVNDVVQDFGNGVQTATAALDLCLNPPSPTPMPESSESNESGESTESHESSGSHESGSGSHESGSGSHESSSESGESNETTEGNNEGTTGEATGTEGNNEGTTGEETGTEGNNEGTTGNGEEAGTEGNNEGTTGEEVGTEGNNEGTTGNGEETGNEGTTGEGAEGTTAAEGGEEEHSEGGSGGEQGGETTPEAPEQGGEVSTGLPEVGEGEENVTGGEENNHTEAPKDNGVIVIENGTL